ncbi:hypothetical protein F5H01DRAFT_347021 [Linnemannia elongata]|nr:hypothetical protein F5H01DRAFT_347021 [Linnemannia elongata]
MAGEESKQTNDNENQINKNTRKMARKKWRIEHPFIMRACPCLIFYMPSRGSNCTLAWFLLFMFWLFWLFWLPCLYTCVTTGGTTNDSSARKEKKYQQKLTKRARPNPQQPCYAITILLPSPLVAPLTSVSLLFSLHGFALD